MDEHCGGSAQGPFCVRRSPGQDSAFTCAQCRAHDDCREAARPRCDLQVDAHRCMPCNEIQGQCPLDSTCLLTQSGEGICTEKTLYFAQGSGCEGADGSKDRPYCSLLELLRGVDPLVPTTIWFLSEDTSRMSILLPDRAKLSLVGAHTLTPQLYVGKDSQVSLHRLGLESNLLVADGAKLRLDGVEVRNGSTLELFPGAYAVVERSVFKSNGLPMGAPLFSLDSAKLELGSSVVANQLIASDDANRDKLALFRLDQGSTLTLDHVTVVDNDLKGVAPLFRCLDPQSKISLQDSILLDFQKSSQILCTASALQVQRVLSDRARLVELGGAQWTAPAWERYFRDPKAQDFGLSNGEGLQGDTTWQQIQSLGQWTAGRTPRDLDGEPWQAGPGCVGADQVK